MYLYFLIVKIIIKSQKEIVIHVCLGITFLVSNLFNIQQVVRKSRTSFNEEEPFVLLLFSFRLGEI